MKRILASLLLVVMLLTCGVASAFAADEGFVDGKFTNTRHITVEVYNRHNDGGSDPTSSPFAQFIKDGMLEKYNVEVEFVSVGRWTEVDDLNNLLAGNDAPDICVTYSFPTIQTYANMGGITNLTPYLEEYKPLLTNLWDLLGDNNIYYDQDPDTKELWAIEAILAENARINTFIREDWLKKLDLPMPTTEEEFHDCLVKFKKNAELLLGEDAAKMIPYTTSYDIGWRNDLLNISKVPNDVTDKELFIHGFDDRHLLYPNYKEGIRVLNKWYNEGLVWKDFALYGSGDTTEDDMLKAGFVGAFQHNWDYPYRNGDDSIQANLKRNVGEDAAFIAVDCFKNDAGEYRKYLANSVDRKVFFPATNDEPLASLLYLDFISDPANLLFLQTGVENVNHVRMENGAYKTIAATGEYIMNSGMNIDHTITVNGLHIGEYTTVSQALNYAGIEPHYIEVALQCAKNGGRVVTAFHVGAINSEEGIGTALTDKRDTFLCQAVVAPEADFDKIYDAGMEDYLASGGQDIINERAEKYAQYYGE